MSPTTTQTGLEIPTCPRPDSLEALIVNLRQYLGSLSGITSDNIEVDRLKSLLDAYKPSKDEWRRFGSADPSKAYTRLLVESINGASNLLFIVWNPGRKSPIHDHAASHCVMKVVDGSLRETVYSNPTTQQKLDLKTATEYREGQVTYISDDIGLHEVQNGNRDSVSVSLHLYTPPNAADYGYNIYDPNTGKCSHVAGAKAVSLETRH